MPTSEIIAVGSELLGSDRLDTNSLWLTEQLNMLGFSVEQKTVVGDDMERLSQAIREALSRSALVITTGGLGPTEDDITRAAASIATGRRLIQSSEVLSFIKERFAKFGRPMPEINSRQALVLEGAQILDNPNGTAPGMFLETGEKRLVLLPGPPRELKPMVVNHVLPQLQRGSSTKGYFRRVLKVCGMGESAVDELIAPYYKKYCDIRTSILFNRSEIEVHLSTAASSLKEADNCLTPLIDEISAKLGNSLFSIRGESMEEVVGQLLADKNLTVSFAESCTGGLISERITSVSGSSRYFMQGVITYSNSSKVSLLGVPVELLERHGAVSAPVAEAMALGLLQRAETTFAVSVTGIAGPEGGTEEKPVGLVFIGLASREGVGHIRVQLPGDRELVRWRASQAALDYLRRECLKL
jgi:nicotinamide-nucleotide amidase